VSLEQLMKKEKQEQEKRILSSFEIAEMFQVAEQKPRDCMMLKCLYYLGLSNSEVQNLQVADFNFENSKVRVVRGAKKTVRDVTIPSGFDQEVKQFLAGLSGIVFSGRSSGKVSDRHIRRIVKSYACKAKIENGSEIHPHSLKDSYEFHVKNSTD